MENSTFIVRIYRYEKGDPRGLVGVVEEVGRGNRKAFTTFDGLQEIVGAILQTIAGRRKGRASRRGPGRGGESMRKTGSGSRPGNRGTK